MLKFPKWQHDNDCDGDIDDDDSGCCIPTDSSGCSVNSDCCDSGALCNGGWCEDTVDCRDQGYPLCWSLSCLMPGNYACCSISRGNPSVIEGAATAISVY